MYEKFDVTGMSCSACSSRIQDTLNKTNGVKKAEVNLLTASMTVDFDEKTVSTENIIRIVEDLGYGASKKGETVEKKTENTAEKTKKRLLLSVCFLLPLMYVSMGHMIGAPLPSFLVGTNNSVNFAFLQFLLCLPVLYINRKFYKNGFKALLKKSPNMDSLIAVGSFASLLYGIFAIFRMNYGMATGNIELVHRYHGDLYFETAATIPTLITLGKYFEEKSKGKTSDAIKKIMNLSPKKAIVILDGKEVLVDTEDLKIGDIVVIKPGMSIPCDGVVISGETSIDESMLTGESVPKEKAVGDSVTTATVNKSGYIEVRAEKVGENTTFSEIVRLIEEASSKKAPISKLADKVSAYFVPIVIIIAVVTFLIWLLAGASFETALSFGICVLVISCPCALGLATPVAVMVGTGKGAENGILIKSGEALETAHNIDTVVFDKTGTITEGKPSVTDIFGNDEKFMPILTALEQRSEHPISKAIIEFAEGKGVAPLVVDKFELISGSGIRAEINEKNCYAVNKTYALQMGCDISEYEADFERLSNDGKTVIFVIEENNVLGMVAVADTIKETAKETSELLKAMGIELVMLTGDNELTAKAISKKAGIDRYIAGILPSDKEREVQKLINAGKTVAMVGDGINDAPALATANVGMAIGTGTDVAIESADVVLMSDSLLAVPNAIKLSKSVLKNIKENLFWAFFYNVVGIPIAAGVFYKAFGLRLSPMLGALAMSLSSLFVVSNALRLKNVKLYQNKNNNKKEEIKMKKVMIEGMMCMHCVAHVTKAFEEKGITANVSLEEKCAYVPNEVDNNDIIDIVKNAGYEVEGIELLNLSTKIDISIN